MALLRIFHSHLYPGARGASEVRPGGLCGDCLLEFSDGMTVTVRIGPGPLPSVPAHRTARGTAIPARNWRLEIAAEAGGSRLMIPGRAGG